MKTKEPLDAEELKPVIVEAVTEAFHRMGLDSGDHLAMQRDMAWLRRRREAGERIHAMSIGTAISVMIAALLGALWLGIQALLNHK